MRVCFNKGRKRSSLRSFRFSRHANLPISQISSYQHVRICKGLEPVNKAGYPRERGPLPRCHHHFFLTPRKRSCERSHPLVAPGLLTVPGLQKENNIKNGRLQVVLINGLRPTLGRAGGSCNVSPRANALSTLGAPSCAYQKPISAQALGTLLVDTGGE